MPHYSYSLEDAVPIADLEAKENFSDSGAAIEHAKQIAKDLARSMVARPFQGGLPTGAARFAAAQIL